MKPLASIARRIAGLEADHRPRDTFTLEAVEEDIRRMEAGLPPLIEPWRVAQRYWHLIGQIHDEDQHEGQPGSSPWPSICRLCEPYRR